MDLGFLLEALELDALYLKCRLLSLPYITIWRAVNGHTMSLATVKKISKILELSPNELFEEVDDENI